MTNSSRSSFFSLIICAVLLLFLTFLFIFPRQYLSNFLNDITYHALNTRNAITQNDRKKAADNAEDMLVCFDKASKPLKLFLNHEDVDDLGLCINSCYYTVKTPDSELVDIAHNIENILKKCEYLFDVETLSLYNLF